MKAINVKIIDKNTLVMTVHFPKWWWFSAYTKQYAYYNKGGFGPYSTGWTALPEGGRVSPYEGKPSGGDLEGLFYSYQTMRTLEDTNE